MSKKRYTKKRKNSKRKPNNYMYMKWGKSCQCMRGGDCGCGGKNLVPMKPDGILFQGGMVGFQPNGLPTNIASYNDTAYYGNGDVARMAESARFMGGKKGKRKTKRYLGKIIKGGVGWLSFLGTGFNDPLGGGGKDILSAFGTTAGAAVNAKIYGGIPVEEQSGTIYNNGIKPLV